MGVTQLWQILSPVAEHRPLTALRGQTLAVDLSIWVCETQCVKQMQGIVSKPFLRNLFFRISHLSQLGVKLVFVIEGSAPEIKWETMMKRQQARFPGRQGKAGGAKPVGSQNHRNFNACLKECCELLDILGIPYIQSKGEAEALCALLNSAGLVDGCLTNDGDAFLYGATTIYRNFTMNSKDPHVEMYRMSDIEAQLGIDRGGLVALGLLIGCDFVPKGVPGIGVANAVKLLQSLRGTDVLKRLQQWRSMPESSCLDQVEVATRRKALGLSDFPHIKVINEFLIAKDRCPSRLSPWKRPVPAKLQEFALLKLEWPAEYTLEKVLPLTTLWDMQDILQSTNPSSHQHLKPHRIVKTRIRQGEPCFEVEWSKPVTDTHTEGSFYVTVECQDMFSRCYPHIVECFNTESKSKNKAKGKKKKKKKKEASTTVDNLSFNFNKMNLAEVTNRLTETVNDLPTDFNTYNECNLVPKAKQPKHLTLESLSSKPASGSKVANKKRSESDQDKLNSIFNLDKNPAVASRKLSETVLETSKSEVGFIPLSERVKLRMQNKAETHDVCVKSNTSELSDLSSLLEEVENLSFSENKLKSSVSSACSNSKVNTKFPLHFTPVAAPAKAANLQTWQRGMSSAAQKMSSPFSANACSPMSYIRQSLTGNPNAQQSPIPNSSPSVTGLSYTKDRPAHLMPNFHKPVAEKCTAEKIATKLEAGIMNVVKPQKNDLKGFSFFDKAEKLSKCDTLSAKTPVVISVNDKVNTPKSVNKSSLDHSSLGLDASQFGNFEIQTSLLNSLCSSLIQALTPKGVTISKEEYENLMSTLNEINKEEEITKSTEGEGLDLACTIDFSDIEKASSELKKIQTGLTLDPIRLVGDSQVVENVEARSKSSRKKLRRKEKRRALEDIAHLNNMSQRIMNNLGNEAQSKQGKIVDVGRDGNSSSSVQVAVATTKSHLPNSTKNNSFEGNKKLGNSEGNLARRKHPDSEPVKNKHSVCSKANEESTRSLSCNGSSNKKNILIHMDENTSKCKQETPNDTTSNNKNVNSKSHQVAGKATTGNTKKPASENASCKAANETQKVVTVKCEADSKEKHKSKSAGKEPCKPTGKPCSTNYSCHKAHNSPESTSENIPRPNIGKPGLVMAPFTVSKSPCPITSPQKDAKQAEQVFPSPSICKNILSEMDALFERDEHKEDADVESFASGDSVPVKKKKKKKKIKKASPLIDVSAHTSINLCEDYLKNALAKFKKEKIIQKASPVFDISADESILELESLSSKLVGVCVEKEKSNRLALLKKRQMLAEKEKSLTMTDTVTDSTHVSVETAGQSTETPECSDSSAVETGHENIKPLIPIGLEKKVDSDHEADEISDKSFLPKFEEILDLDDVGDDMSEFVDQYYSAAKSALEDFEENEYENSETGSKQNELVSKEFSRTTLQNAQNPFVGQSRHNECSDSDFEDSNMNDKATLELDQSGNMGMISISELLVGELKKSIEADELLTINLYGLHNHAMQNAEKETVVTEHHDSNETHDQIDSEVGPVEYLKVVDPCALMEENERVMSGDTDVKHGEQYDRDVTDMNVEDLPECHIVHDNKVDKNINGKMHFSDDQTEKYDSADEEIFVDASGDASLNNGSENVDVGDTKICINVDTNNQEDIKTVERSSVLDEENYAKQSVEVQPLPVQSPACLAERLKLRLQKKSVRSVLETFTNGKFE